MRAILIIDCEGPNPHFDPKREEGPDNLQTIVIPAGAAISGRMAWIHCVPDFCDVVRARPDDDECQAAVDRHLNRVNKVLAARSAQQAASAAFTTNEADDSASDDLLPDDEKDDIL